MKNGFLWDDDDAMHEIFYVKNNISVKLVGAKAWKCVTKLMINIIPS